MAIIQPEDLDLDDDADPKQVVRPCKRTMQLHILLSPSLHFPCWIQVYRALKQLDIKQATGE